MKKVQAFYIAFFYLGAFAINANAQKTLASPADSIKTFLNKAYTYNISEIDNGNLALKKAKDGGVKSFGSQVATDDIQFNTQLLNLCKWNDFKKPKIDTAITLKPKVLDKSTGGEFDSLYLTGNISTDEAVIKLYQTSLTRIKDPELLAYITKSLPVLTEHLKSAKALAAQLNISKH